MRIFTLMLILTTTLFGVAFGMSDTLAVFERYSEDDGLSQNTVTAIREDRKGFLWVGTINGLNRFDGYRFAVYKSDPREPHSIANNYITAIIETRSGVLWVGTNKGLSRFDPSIDGFRSFTNDANDPNSLGNDEVRTLYEDRAGDLWVGTEGGIHKFNADADNFTNYDSAVFSTRGFRGITEDLNGGFWVGAANGLTKFDRQTGSVIKHFPADSKNPKSMITKPVRAMITDRTGMLWVGALDGGLTRFDPTTEAFSRYVADADRQGSLSDNGVRSMCETSDGSIWIGTGTALDRYSAEKDEFVHFRHDPKNIRSLGEGDIPTIADGRNGQLWVGTSVGGLSKLNRKADRFERFRHNPDDANSLTDDYYIHSILEDENRVVWIATQRGGLNKLDLATGRFSVVKTLGDPKENSAVALVSAILQNRAGEFWLGTPLKGLLNLDRGNGQFKAYANDPKNPNELPGYLIYSITEDSSGLLWLGTGKGLHRFEPSTGKFKLYPFGANGLTGQSVWCVFADSRDAIWVSTNLGLHKFDPLAESSTYFKPALNDPKTLRPGEQIDSITEDKDGNLWMASDNGLVKFVRASDTFEHFGEGDALPSNNIATILIDDSTGDLWLGTGKGLARFDPDSRTIRTYDVRDGLLHSEFTPRAAFKNRAGEMYFGAVRGFVKFDPRGFSESEYKPPVYLSDIRILEQSARFRQNISELKEFDVSWQQNVVSFDFAALDLTDPGKLRYQWKLDGFDENWINGGTRRTATYTNLPGGEYVLKVRATSVDGVWGDEMVNLIVRVQPPFYRTFWFWLLVAVVVGILILLLYRYRIGQLQAISEAQTRFTQQLITSQEAERKRIAAELHDGLGQSLVIIKNRAMLGISKGEDKERVAKELGSISESASQALDEVREITNNLRPQLLDRLGLTKAIAAMLKKYTGVIDIKSDIDTIDGIFAENEEISIYRIVQESMNNTIKHSNASTAKVKIKRIENRVLVEIKDNGKGFDPQSLPTEKRSFGLTGLRERAQLLGGELVIDSQIGVGTKVSVTFRVTGTQAPSPRAPVPPA
ncbi:MAG: two-component regulator propeller domain-containing protein [Pyrinomonadaceae bacterium]